MDTGILVLMTDTGDRIYIEDVPYEQAYTIINSIGDGPDLGDTAYEDDDPHANMFFNISQSIVFGHWIQDGYEYLDKFCGNITFVEAAQG